PGAQGVAPRPDPGAAVRVMTGPPILLLVALSARTVSLAEAEHAAEAQGPDGRAAHANTAVGVARTEQARAGLLPQIKAEGEYDRTTGNRRQRPNRTTQVDKIGRT